MFVLNLIFDWYKYSIDVDNNNCVTPIVNNFKTALFEQGGELIGDIVITKTNIAFSLRNTKLSQIKTLLQKFFIGTIHSDSDAGHNHHNQVIMNDKDDKKDCKDDKKDKKDCKDSKKNCKEDKKEQTSTKSLKEKTKTEKTTKTEKVEKIEDHSMENYDIVIKKIDPLKNLPKNLKDSFNKDISSDQQNFEIYTVHIALNEKQLDHIKKNIKNGVVNSIYGRIGEPKLFHHSSDGFYVRSPLTTQNMESSSISLRYMINNSPIKMKYNSGTQGVSEPIMMHNSTMPLFSKVFSQDKMIVGSLLPKAMEYLTVLAKQKKFHSVCWEMNGQILHVFTLEIAHINRDMVLKVVEDDNVQNNDFVKQLSYPIDNYVKFSEPVKSRPTFRMNQILCFLALIIMGLYLAIVEKRRRNLGLIATGLVFPAESLILMIVGLITTNNIMRGVVPFVISPIVVKVLYGSSIKGNQFMYGMIIVGIIWMCLELLCCKKCDSNTNNDNNCNNNSCSS